VAGISIAVRALMALSGVVGLTMFILANFYLSRRPGLKLTTALLQIGVNCFVFCSWLNGFVQATPGTLVRLVALVGFIVPCCMVSITVVRVVVPELIRRAKVSNSS